MVLPDQTLGGQRAVPVESLAGVAKHKIIQRAVAGAGVAGDNFTSRAEERDIGNAADVHDEQRFRQVLRQRGVEQRHQRRALATCRDIGAPKIVNHLAARPRRQ